MRQTLTIILLLLNTLLCAQSNDSIILFNTVLERSLKLHFYGKTDSALVYLKRLKAFPIDHITDEQRLKFVRAYADLEKDKTKAIAILAEAELLEEQKNNKENLAQIMYARGSNYYKWHNDHKALIYFIKSDSLFEFLKADHWLAVMSKVGIVNVLMKSDYKTDATKFDRAVPYINEGIALADSIGFDVGTSILLEKKGHYLQLRDRLEESKEVYQEGLRLSKRIKYTLRESSIYDGLAKVHFKEKNVDSAAYYYEKHLGLIEETSLPMDIAEAHYNIGRFYNQISDFETAKNHLDEAWDMIGELPVVRKEYPYNIQNELAISYTMLGNHKMAINCLNTAKDLLEEVHNIKNAENIRELETRYRTEKKEQEIALLKSKHELAEQQKKSQHKILLGGIGITSFSLVLLFVLYKNRLRTTRKLKELDALKTNFFINISHEFRTPLTLISSPIQELLEETNLSNKKRKHFEVAQKNTKKLSSLVDQLLELSKIDSGNRKLSLQKNKPTQNIAAWSESFSYLAKQKNIHFKTKILNKDATAWFDREALETIVVNLVGNAIKYTPEEGEIDLQASLQNNLLDIAIKNSGQGLTNKQVNTVFNRFYQTNGQSDGAGIGLSLVKELAELHGGKIMISSELKKWTLFEVTLCLDKSKFNNAEIKEDNELLVVKTATDHRIIELQKGPEIQNNELPILLIVEDNSDLRTLLEDTFKKDYKVTLVVNGEEGILKALDIIPDLIISDIMMPVKDGIELTRSLKKDQRTCHIPIILLTARAGDDNELLGIEVGADDYITKPFNQKILKSKANRLIALRKVLQSRYSQEVILKPKDIAITSVDEVFLKNVQEVLDKHLVESSFTIEGFSKAVHMSRMQLHRKLKALTGLSASEFLRSQRLKLAAQLLKKGDHSISEISYSVGFNDSTYFTKCFRETYQSTPSEYSKKFSKQKA